MLITVFLVASAAALPDPIILPDGPGYLGILHPEKKNTERMDAVLLDPRTGKLWLEHSDDNTENRVYRDGSWELSGRAVYEHKDDVLTSATDIWGVVVQYEYKKGDLSGIRWPSGREIRIAYDQKKRVQKLVDSTGQILSVHWWNDERATITDQLGYSIQWTVKPDSIWVKDSMGHSVRGLYDQGVFVGWEDPRGQQMQILRKENQLYLRDGFSKTWTIEQEDKKILSLAISGVGSWSWKRNEQGDIFEIVDPSKKKLVVDRNSLGKARVYRPDGALDFSYDSNNRLKEISDNFGHLVRVRRDSFGQIILLEDALGGTISFGRGEGGGLKKMTLRNGQEWNFEYDAMKRLRHVISPNQEVIALLRDIGGEIISLDYAGQRKIKFSRDSRGRIRKIDDSIGGTRELRLDALGRVVYDSLGDMKLGYDALGNISSVSRQKKSWKITRDGYGEISRWNGISFGRNSAGLIISIQDPDGKWMLLRDAAGRIQSIERADKLISVEYDELGFPRVWIDGEKTTQIKRNQYGWVIREGDVEIKRDRRGWIKNIQYGDSEWEWRRDGSGFVLQAFLQKRMRLGLERDDTGQLVALKFPNGAYQRWSRRSDKLQEKLVGVDGQILEQNQYVMTEDGWSSSAQQVFQDSVTEASLYEYDTIGLRVREGQSNLEIYDYDAFNRLSQVCGVDGCHHFYYDPLGRLISYQDANAFPIAMLWGRNGIENEEGAFEMVPLLHGGEYWLHSPFGLGLIWGFTNVPEGDISSLRGERNWYVQGNEVVSRASLGERDDTMFFAQRRLIHEELGISFVNGLAWDEKEQRYLQADTFWQRDSEEAQLFTLASQRSIWSDPLQILFQMNIIEPEYRWSSVDSEPEFLWLNPTIQEYARLSMPTIQDFPFYEEGIEQYMIMQLLKGRTDPSNSAIVQHIIEQEFTEIPVFFQKGINKCVGSLAFYFQCG